MPRCVVLAILLTSATALAGGGGERARALYAQGKDLVAHHAYLDAADKFIAAYNLAPEPDYLLEIARTYRSADACAKAAHYYRAYLAVRHLSLDGAIGRELAEMDTCARTQPVAPTSSTEPVPSAPTPASVPDEPAPAIEPTPEPVEPAPERAHGHPAAIALTVAGMALLGTGVGFGVDAAAAQTDREDLCPAPCTWSAALGKRATALDARGNRDTIISVAGIAGGVLAIGGGLALYFARRSADRAVVIAPAPGGASLAFTF